MKYYRLIKRLVYKAWYQFIYIPVNYEKFAGLKQFKNIHKGERVFIVATGPSLTPTDLDLLKNEKTFSMNSVFKMFDKTDWRPTYYCIADGGVYQKIKDEVDAQPLNVCFVNDNIPWNSDKVNRLPVVANICNTEELRTSFPNLNNSHTSSDIKSGIYMGNSVVHVITQICFYMGFTEIYYIGADCTNFKIHAADCDHNLSINRSEISLAQGIKADYESDYEFAKKLGVKMYNATRGGALEVFPRIVLGDLFSN